MTNDFDTDELFENTKITPNKTVKEEIKNTVKEELPLWNMDVSENKEIAKPKEEVKEEPPKEETIDLFKEEGIEIKNHNDAGKIIYQREKQKAFCGGSGIACLPLVAYTKIYEKLKKKEYRKVLLAATGALFDPVYVQQKQSIPAICHCYTIERG